MKVQFLASICASFLCAVASASDISQEPSLAIDKSTKGLGGVLVAVTDEVANLNDAAATGLEEDSLIASDELESDELEDGYYGGGYRKAYRAGARRGYYGSDSLSRSGRRRRRRVDGYRRAYRAGERRGERRNRYNSFRSNGRRRRRRVDGYRRAYRAGERRGERRNRYNSFRSNGRRRGYHGARAYGEGYKNGRGISSWSGDYDIDEDEVGEDEMDAPQGSQDIKEEELPTDESADEDSSDIVSTN